jgi:hypothetical protein
MIQIAPCREGDPTQLSSEENQSRKDEKRV